MLFVGLFVSTQVLVKRNKNKWLILRKQVGACEQGLSNEVLASPSAHMQLSAATRPVHEVERYKAWDVACLMQNAYPTSHTGRIVS